METTAAQRSFSRYAWAALAYNLPIILFGAVVRATGSGAGCGDHWPLCNGPGAPLLHNLQRQIEFTHHVSSGLVIPIAAGLLWLALRTFPPGHLARRAAVAVVCLSFGEALLGAALVLFKLVAHDASVYRAVAIAAHLTNTLLLIAAFTLAAWWGTDPRPVRISEQGGLGGLLTIAIVAAIVLGISGAITALGDTLFPATSVAEYGRHVAPTAHFLQKLRVYHPYLAVSVGTYLVSVAALACQLRPSDQVRNFAYAVGLLVAAQIGAGFLNLLLLAPLWMQLVHLFLADALWIALVLLTASACAEGTPRRIPKLLRRAGPDLLGRAAPDA